MKERIIVTSCLSTSGKWRLILAYHIVAGQFCWDVVAKNETTGVMTTRHYKGVDDSACKAEAYRIYDDYKKKLTAPAKSEEKDERPKYRVTKS